MLHKCNLFLSFCLSLLFGAKKTNVRNRFACDAFTFITAFGMTETRRNDSLEIYAIGSLDYNNSYRHSSVPPLPAPASLAPSMQFLFNQKRRFHISRRSPSSSCTPLSHRHSRTGGNPEIGCQCLKMLSQRPFSGFQPLSPQACRSFVAETRIELCMICESS